MSTKIKICGVKTVEDALLSVEAGADALGLNFYPPSPRYVAPAQARNIVVELPPFVLRIGVFVDTPPEDVREIADEVGLHAVQLHGSEPASEAPRYGRPIIPAVKIRSEEDIERINALPERTLLVDAYKKGLHGGTGQTFNWKWLHGITEKKRIILAGGLNPENVADAIRTVHPYAVDVASGVESSPGRKDPELVERFVSAVREADRE